MLTPPKKLARVSLEARATAAVTMPAEAKSGVTFMCHRSRSQKAPWARSTITTKLSTKGSAEISAVSPRRRFISALKIVRESRMPTMVHNMMSRE